MLLTVDQTHAIAKGDFGSRTVALVSRLEGRKLWPSAHTVKFEATEHNVRSFVELFPDATVQDNRPINKAMEEWAGATSGHSEGVGAEKSSVPLPAHRAGVAARFRMEPFPFQLDAYERFKDKPVFALFAEQGTGKTKMTIDIISYRWLMGRLAAVIVFAWPKGVHRQWVEEQFTKHLWEGIPYRAAAWDGKKWPDWFGKATPGELQIVTANIEMVNSDRARSTLYPLFNLHGDKLMMLVDESQTIKNASSSRSKHMQAFGKMVQQRAILTGTPIARDLTDEWAQFKFLDERIIGQKYKTAFQAQYCKMGGFQNKAVIGHRNLESFNALVAPHIFRVTKAEGLDLPEKVYDKIVFDMTPEQRRVQKELKQSFITQLNSGAIASVVNAAGLVTRLQQLACGYFVDDDGKVHAISPNPRVEALDALLGARQGKKIIWCRFNKDIETLIAKYGKKAVSFYGATSNKDRVAAKEQFIDPYSDVELFIANPAAAGTGVDGLQMCRTVIYYSNSYNALERWQSEDRTHRIGMGGTCTYFDIVARGSVDVAILANLRKKKSLSDFVLDDIRRMVNEL